MNIAVLGTGVVGKTIATALVELGHSVRMGSRTANNPKAAEWVAGAGSNGSQGTFADAAAFGNVVFLCLLGTGALEALELAEEENLNDKIIIDITNPLDFSKADFARGIGPTLYVSGGGDSLGEQVQRRVPGAHVVKALNTVTARVMVNPGMLPGQHDLLICGNNAEAKSQVKEWLREWFGWQSIVDLGDITGARATEGYLLLWLKLFGAIGTPNFNLRVVR
ncbi:MAG: NAD(P)-binding domain-containing protein [Candidatus Kapabacteria bacterium]|nr:NAD(P)-binding domain-containing protein [Candidatus Kapabacteria bacterium]